MTTNLITRSYELITGNNELLFLNEYTIGIHAWRFLKEPPERQYKCVVNNEKRIFEFWSKYECKILVTWILRSN